MNKYSTNSHINQYISTRYQHTNLIIEAIKRIYSKIDMATKHRRRYKEYMKLALKATNANAIVGLLQSIPTYGLFNNIWFIQISERNTEWFRGFINSI